MKHDIKIFFESVMEEPNRRQSLISKGRNVELVEPLEEDEAIKKAIDIYCIAEFQLSQEEKVMEAIKLKFELYATEKEKTAVEQLEVKMEEARSKKMDLIDHKDIKVAEKEIMGLKSQIESIYKREI